jgi:splicing factor 3B subunit 3
VDGALCELYNHLPAERKRAIAVEFERNTFEVGRKLQDMRTLVAF